MKTLKERILERMPNLKEEEIFKNTITIAFAISIVAHTGQYRDNGEPYVNHPKRLNEKYMNLMTIDDHPISKIALVLNGLPYEGVREVCFLHDVVEDTEVSHEEIRGLYTEYGFGDFFNEYIDVPLRLMTHDKSEPYESYINKVMTNPISSFVKLLDLSDNLNPFGLMHLDDASLERSKRYLDYFKMINDKYLFLAKIVNAREMEMHNLESEDINNA